jgi:DNA mismatch endonuclease (patch repair protein)
LRIYLRENEDAPFMPDVFTKEKRSQVMARIRSKGSKIEMKMKEALDEHEITYEYQPKLFGKPDFLVKPRTVIFCDSSFWHGRNWKKLKKKLRKRYWKDHIRKNIERDALVTETLRNQGYAVLRFWDDEIKKNLEECIKRILCSHHSVVKDDG